MHKAQVALWQPRRTRRSNTKDGWISILDLHILRDLRGV